MLDEPPKPPRGGSALDGFYAGFAVAVALAILAFVVWQRGGFSSIHERHRPSYTSMIAAPEPGPESVPEQITPPEVKPHGVELVTDKAKRAADALRRGDHQTANQLASEVLQRSALRGGFFQPFSRFMATLTNGNDPEFLDTVNRWIDEEPKSVVAYLIRAKYYERTGWATRGEDYPSYIKQEHLILFKKYLQLAGADAQQSIVLDPNVPYGYALALYDVSWSANSGAANEAFHVGIARFPDYYELYRSRLYSLTPKWGGSKSAMYSFVDRWAGRAAENSPLKLLYVQLYANLADDALVDCKQSKAADIMRCINEATSNSVTPDLETGLSQAMNLFKNSDPIEVSNALWPVMDGMVNGSGASDAINEVLQAAANGSGTNTELIHGGGRNNYVLDDITAQVWAMMGNLANADQKFNEALVDADRTSFEDEEAKDVAIGGIYDDMTQVARNASKYDKMMAYHDAANMAAGSNHGGIPYFKCFALFKLNRFQEAVEECTHILETNGYSLYAHYYRARANEGLKNWDAALAEFEPIAEGENNYIRVGAAIDMDHIHALQGDYIGSLAILNKYTYLFDTSMQPADDLAISFNNRCFAYMKLGELQKALDDCNTSLKYGRLPDALSKQQQLLKLLKNAPTT